MKTPARKLLPPFDQVLFQRVQEALNDAVRQRAYELFLQRGGEPGHDLDDWLLAESELMEAAPVEVMEDADDVIVRIAAPGFGLADLEWDMGERHVAVAGRHECTLQGSGGDGAYSSTRLRYLLKSVELPVAVDAGGACMTMVNDVVEIRLPRRQPMARPAAQAA
jgi:HSP20 family molecular chaperone IbpA